MTKVDKKKKSFPQRKIFSAPKKGAAKRVFLDVDDSSVDSVEFKDEGNKNNQLAEETRSQSELHKASEVSVKTKNIVPQARKNPIVNPKEPDCKPESKPQRYSKVEAVSSNSSVDAATLVSDEIEQFKNNGNHLVSPKVLPTKTFDAIEKDNVLGEPVVDVDIIDVLRTLTETQAKLFFFLAGLIRKRDGASTGRIKRSLIINATGIGRETIKTAERALIKRQLIKKAGWGSGHCGYTIYEFASPLVKQLSAEYEHLYGINYYSINASEGDLTSVPAFSAVSDSLPEAWKKIDVEPLKNYNFGKVELIDIHRSYISNPERQLEPDIIETSIRNFAYDLEFGKEYLPEYLKKDPINKFVDILRKGKAYRSLTPGGYKDPNLVILEKMLSEEQERKKIIAQKEQELKHIAFDNWQSNLTKEQMLEIAGQLPRVSENIKSKIISEKIKEHFYNVVWEEKKKEFVC